MKRYFNKRELNGLNYKTASLRYGRKLMAELPEAFDWDKISENAWETQLTPDFVHEFAERLNWDNEFIEFIASHEAFTEEFIEKHLDYIYNINLILKSRRVSEKFMIDHYDELDKLIISEYQPLSNNFLIAHGKDLFLDRVTYDEPLDRVAFDYLVHNCKFDWNNPTLKFAGDFADESYNMILREYPIKVYGLRMLLRQVKFPEEILKSAIKDCADWYDAMQTQFFTEKFFWKLWKKYYKEFRATHLPKELDPEVRNTCYTENWSKKFKKEYCKHNRKVSKKLAKRK